MKRVIILFITVQWISFAWAQPLQLQGKVSAIDGNGLVGVTVTAEESGAGTVTDLEGNYQIAVNAGDRLTFTRFGFKKETLAFTGQEVLNVTLREGYDAALLKVTGTVTDARTGEPLSGAQVWTQDRQLSAMSSETGEFEIELPSLYENLSVTAPGYTHREIPVQGRPVLALSLYPQFFTSGYGQKELDFSLSTALSPEIEIQAHLGGEVRTVARSGVPGIGGVMFIRGLNSLNANAQPLILLDGVIWDNQWDNTSIHTGFFSNALANIDVRDIESVTVLKDGAAIYGSKAANGVILINTKRGRDKVTRIAASLYWGTNLKPNVPKMMNATQFREYVGNQIDGWFKNYFPDARPQEQEILNTFPFLNDDASQTSYWKYHNQTDWADAVYSSALTQHYALNVNGGDDIALYNLSLGYVMANGTLAGTDMNRFNLRFNSDVKLAENLYSKVDASVAYSTRNLRDQGIDPISSPEFAALIKAPILSPYRMNDKGEPTSTLESYDMLENVRANAISNPLALLERAEGTSNRLTFRLSVNPHWQVTKNLRLSTLYSYATHSVKESFFIPSVGIAPRVRSDGLFAENEVRDLTQHQASIFSDTRVDWKFGRNSHHFALTGGFRYMTDNYQSDVPRGYNTGNDNIKVLTESILYRIVDGEDDEWKSLSWYAGAGYDWANRYFLTLAASADASSRFGSEAGMRALNVNWAFFPAISAAWVVSSEKFMQYLPAVNFMKLRAGYELTGNDDINAIAARSYLSSVRYVGNAAGLTVANLQNRSIQWETTARANIGIDIHLLNERLGLSFDAFSSRTDNLLTLKSLDAFTGQNAVWSNEGQMTNRGFEMALNFKALNLNRLKWEAGAGIGHYRNKITALPDNQSTCLEILNGRVLTEIGQSAGVFYGYKTHGVFMTEAEAQAANNGNGLFRRKANGENSYYVAGDMYFDDRDGNGEIDEKDWQVIGDPNPDCYGTFTNRFQWRRFALDVLFTYSYGNDVYNALRAQLESGSSFYNQTLAMTNRWQSPLQERTNIPKAVYGDPQGNSDFSDRWIEDGSYFRLKTLAISYDIPFDSPFLQGITLWASANNLWTWTKYLGSDPEFSMNNKVLYQGIDAGLTPAGKSYYVGIKINL
jgi:TonB-linked SusC/RagA family outer membrane protein